MQAEHLPRRGKVGADLSVLREGEKEEEKEGERGRRVPRGRKAQPLSDTAKL